MGEPSFSAAPGAEVSPKGDVPLSALCTHFPKRETRGDRLENSQRGSWTTASFVYCFVYGPVPISRLSLQALAGWPSENVLGDLGSLCRGD